MTDYSDASKINIRLPLTNFSKQLTECFVKKAIKGEMQVVELNTMM